MSGATRVTATFTDHVPFIEALRRLRETGRTEFHVYSPVPLTEHADLMPHRGSPVRWYALGAGVAGCCLGFALCVGASLLYANIVGGKPVVSWVPFCVVAFELTILSAGIVTLGAALLHSRLYPRMPSADYRPESSVDTFAVTVPCGSAECEALKALLRATGADDVTEGST
jgi:molybdopterin-containing oxidoreductase family membrane subunit